MNQDQTNNPALERVSAQRESTAAKHHGSEPTPLVRQQVTEAKAREQALDEQKQHSQQHGVEPSRKA
jgi:hypothetical protein